MVGSDGNCRDGPEQESFDGDIGFEIRSHAFGRDRDRVADPEALGKAHRSSQDGDVNPNLHALAVLVGEWATLGAHPMLPGKTLHGHTTFSWLESGAFLQLHTHIDEPEVPDGTAIFGTDDATPGAGAMLYFDVRNVAREYRWAMSHNVLTWSRDTPEFSQRVVFTIAEDGQSIVAQGEMSRNGQAWEPDLQLTYSRIT